PTHTTRARHQIKGTPTPTNPGGRKEPKTTQTRLSRNNHALLSSQETTANRLQTHTGSSPDAAHHFRALPAPAGFALGFFLYSSASPRVLGPSALEWENRPVRGSYRVRLARFAYPDYRALRSASHILWTDHRARARPEARRRWKTLSHVRPLGESGSARTHMPRSNPYPRMRARRRQSFSSGANLTMRSFCPTPAPKSTRARVRSPVPSTESTVPSPKESWFTLSPGRSASTGRSALRVGRDVRAGDTERRSASVVDSARRQVTSSAGISSKNRDGGL